MKDPSFLEFYGKATYNFTDTFNVGIGAYYTDDWLGTGSDGLYGNVTAKFTGHGAPEWLGLVRVG